MAEELHGWYGYRPVALPALKFNRNLKEPEDKLDQNEKDKEQKQTSIEN